MGKFSRYGSSVAHKPRPWKIHPLWQGIGCIMIVVIPLLSYAGAVLLVDANIENNWYQIPSELIGPPGQQLLYIQIGMTILLSILLYSIFIITYLLIYRFIGPPKYGPTDAPPPRRTKTGRKYSR